MNRNAPVADQDPAGELPAQQEHPEPAEREGKKHVEDGGAVHIQLRQRSENRKNRDSPYGGGRKSDIGVG